VPMKEEKEEDTLCDVCKYIYVRIQTLLAIRQ